MINADSLLLSQYANAPRVRGLVRLMRDGLNPEPDRSALLRDAFDPLTAASWGLDQWGKIVNIGRVMRIEVREESFGFMGSGCAGFDQAAFWRSGATSAYRLADAAFRRLVFLKAAANIAECSVPRLNRLLTMLFPERGPAYALEIGTMALRYVFEFALQPWERALVQRRDAPPKPAGVEYEVLELEPASTFGFAGSGLQPFGRGVFILAGPVPAHA